MTEGISMKQPIALALTAVLAAGLCAPAYAADTAAAQTTPAVYTLRFDELESTVRENNLSVKAFAQQLKSVQETKVSTSYDDQSFTVGVQISQYQAQIKELNDAIAALGSDESSDALRKTLLAQRSALQNSLNALNISYRDLKDSKEDAVDAHKYTLSATQRQLANATDLLCVGAQSTFVSLHALALSEDTLNRSFTQLDRSIATVRAQVGRGMAGTLDLLALQSQREALLASRKTLEVQRANLQSSLAVQCGLGADATLEPAALPDVTDEQLAAMNYEADLAQALKNSYSIWSKQDAAEQASRDYANDITDNVYAYEAAKITAQAEPDNVKAAFRQLYNAVRDKKSALDAANADAAQYNKTFAAQQVQYLRGALPKNDFLQAQDELRALEQAQDSAKINLLTAYNQYEWAKRGVMSTNA